MVLIKPKTAYFRRFILVKPYKSLFAEVYYDDFAIYPKKLLA